MLYWVSIFLVMAQAYSYFLIEYEKVDIFLIQNKDNINHKSFFQKWLIWIIVVEWAYIGTDLRHVTFCADMFGKPPT